MPAPGFGWGGRRGNVTAGVGTPSVCNGGSATVISFSFPGSAWECMVRTALPCDYRPSRHGLQREGRAFRAVRTQAEPGYEELKVGIHEPAGIQQVFGIELAFDFFHQHSSIGRRSPD